MKMLVFWIVCSIGLFAIDWVFRDIVEFNLHKEIAMKQFKDNQDAIQQRQLWDTGINVVREILIFSWWFSTGYLISRYLRKVFSMKKVGLLVLLCIFPFLEGCRRPFHEPDLQKIDTSETAFLLPLTGDIKDQDAFVSEEYLQKNLIAAKEVEIPYRWVPIGYETLFPNGKWVPSARLVKVDRTPQTRTWTADPNTGSSNKNEAIWVMTSDSVCFSTGWTCTARIITTTDAVKFLYNYPSGSLTTVMDTEIRSKLEAVFGLLVTDRPMDELRNNATPLFEQTRETLEEFFKERGITITNLGISGGYVYQDPKIQETLNKVFQSNQARLTAQAETEAQIESNKRIKLEAEGLADAAKLKAQGEAEAIKVVADAKQYELEKAKENLEYYILLKKLELEKEKLNRWDGKFPTYYMGGSEKAPDFLLQVPTPNIEKAGK